MGNHRGKAGVEQALAWGFGVGHSGLERLPPDGYEVVESMVEVVAAAAGGAVV
jgi:hypothetical protein